MGDVIPTLLAFPPEKKKDKLSPKEYDVAIVAHVTALRKFSNNAFMKGVDKQDVFERLDPETHSVSYLHALIHYLEYTPKNTTQYEQLVQLAFVFLVSFNPVQVRYAGGEWQTIFEFCCRQMEKSNTANVIPLVAALLRLDPSGGTFTSHHLKVLRLALQFGVPSQVLPLLDKDIYAFPQKSVKNAPEETLAEEHELSNVYITESSGFSLRIQSEHVLEYYLLGAHAYIAVRNWARARLFLEYVLLSPTQQHICSALQVESYKKWLLIGLLSQGKPFPLPRTIDQGVTKNLKAISRAYEALAEDFERRDYKKFLADAQEGANIWPEDGNHRLVKEASDALMRHRVIDLQKTYAALPVTLVATHVDLPADETLQLVTSMVQSGHLRASIATGGSEPVLRFHETAAEPTTLDTDFESQTQRIAQLVTFIRDADRRLQLTKEYVDYQRRVKRTGGPDGDMADLMDLQWDGPSATVDDDGDEDIMGL